MEFKEFFSTLKNRISDNLDVPQFFRDLFAMITDVPEEEWGTPKDPVTKKAKDSTLRSYAKRTIPKTFARQIVYRLSKENYIESLNSRTFDTRDLLAEDFSVYDAEINGNNVAEKTAEWFVEIIRNAAGLAPQDDMQKQKQQQLAIALKRKYGDYLYNEAGGFCAFPGCGKQLTVANNGKVAHLYEVSLIDKQKEPTPDNLLALCPHCYSTYLIDDRKQITKDLVGIKQILISRKNSIHMLEGLPLEAGISGVIKRISKLKINDVENPSFEPKEIKVKIDPSSDLALYMTVKNYVTTYFLQIKEIMQSLDKRGEIDYEEVQDQIHAFYKKLKKAKKSQMEIFNEITSKIHRVTLQDEIYCQIVVSYFVQSCEVFDAITQ